MNIKELVIGGLAGAALAVVATQYLGGAQARPPAASGSPAEAPAAATAPAPATSPSAAPAASAVVAAPVTSAPVASNAKAAATVACPPTPAAVEPRKAASAALPAAMRADVPAVSLSAEHAKILLAQDQQPPTLPELHARFAGEPLDLAWSQPLEARLRQALLDAGVQKGFDLLAVECRRTMCELRLFGTGDEAARRWGAIAAQLTQQPWWGQNVSGMTTSTTTFNDRAVIATILQRPKP